MAFNCEGAEIVSGQMQEFRNRSSGFVCSQPFSCKFVFCSMRSLCLILLLTLFFSGRPPKAGKVNKHVDDFHILIQSLKELDPMLYHVMGKDTFDVRVARAEARLQNVDSTLDAIYIMQEFMYGLGDAHAAITASYGYLGVKRILPFKVFILDKRIYIRNYPERPELNGAEIYSIDKVKSAAIIDSLKIFYPNDGARDIVGFGLPALFNSLYSAFCHESDFYYLETSKGAVNAESCDLGDKYFDELVAYSWTDYTVSDSSFSKKVTNDYGYFRFSNFDRMEEGHNVEDEFNSMLMEVNQRNVKNVIIDLRFNSGGDPYIAGRMATHFVKAPFRIFERLILTNTKHTTYESYMVRNFSYRFRHAGTKQVNDRREKVKFEKGLNEYQPSGLHFDGTVYVLTGPMTGSSATMLCKYLKDLPNVKFVGSETEGAINFFCAHRHCELTLPNSHVYVNFGMQIVELKRGSSENEQPIGLIPENAPSYTIEDLLLRKDKEMEWVVSDITKQ